MISEVALLLALSAGVALISPHPHGAAINLAVVAAPALIGLGMVARAARRSDTQQRPYFPTRSSLALSISLAGLAIPAWIAHRGSDFGVAWAMSGDAQDHVQITRDVLWQGGLTIHELRAYPAAVNAITALISGAGGRAGLAPGQLILHDARAVATTYVLSGIAVACMLAAALLELLPSGVARLRRLPLPVAVVLLACAATSASPLLLGRALLYGFLSAYGALPIAIASIVIAMRFSARPSPTAWALLGPATVITLFTWTFLAVVPASVVLWTTAIVVTRYFKWKSHERSRLRTWAWIAGAVVAVGGLAVSVGAVAMARSTLRGALVLSGSIWAPRFDQITLLAVFGTTAASVLLLARSVAQRLQLAVPLVVAVIGEAVVDWLTYLPGHGSTWMYYTTKSLWLVVCCLIWTGFVPILLAAIALPASAIRPFAFVAASSPAVLLIIGMSTSMTNPIPLALTGWNRPSAVVIKETAKIADTGRPFLLWQWAELTNERIGNFWAALAWDVRPSGAVISYPKLPGGLRHWASNRVDSFFETGAIAQLCSVVRAVPGLLVATQNTDLSTHLMAACSGARARVILDKPTNRTP